MLARLLIGFFAVVVPSAALLGGVTVYSIASLDRVNHQLVQIMRSREAVADLRLTLAQVGDPLGAYVLGRDPRNRERFEGLIRDAEAKLRSCSAALCHVSTRIPEKMAGALAPLIERVKADGRRVFEAGPRDGAGHAETVRQSIARLRDEVEPMLTLEGLLIIYHRNKGGSKSFDH